MPTRKPRSPNEKPQFERFIETARQIGAGETDEALERTIGKIAPAKEGIIKPRPLSKP
jgi:hypothetical protein